MSQTYRQASVLRNTLMPCEGTTVYTRSIHLEKAVTKTELYWWAPQAPYQTLA